MPEMLPANAAAKARGSARRPLKTMYPVNVRSVSSGTGRPTIPNTSSTKIAAYPYCPIQARTCCSMGRGSGGPRRSDHQPRDLHRAAVAAHHHDAALGNMVRGLVAFQVVAYD